MMFGFFVKLSEREAKMQSSKMSLYEDLRKEAGYRIELGKTKTEKYARVFEAAFRHVTGK